MRSRFYMLLALALVVALGVSAWTWAQTEPEKVAAAVAADPATSSRAMADAAAPPTPAFGQAAAQPDAPPAKPVPAELPDVVARVNGEEIWKTEFERAVRNLEARVGQPVPTDRRDDVYRGVLDQLIGYRLLVQESKSRDVKVADADLDTRVQEIRGQFPNEDAFKQALTAQGKSLDDLRNEARESLIVEKLLEGIVDPKVSVAEPEIKAFYDGNQERFKEAESVRASHILIKTEPADSADTKAAAQKKAESVMAEVKSGGDFGALAKQHSSDPGSAAQGGDLGYFGRGQMVPEFEKAAFALKPGELSGLVQSQFGYHIIKVADHRAERVVPLSEASPRISQFLTQQRQQQLTGEFVKGLRAKGRVEVLI